MLQQIKQQLRARMHDPVSQTGEWLKSVVQGYFNYHAVPGNLDSLGVFRDPADSSVNTWRLPTDNHRPGTGHRHFHESPTTRPSELDR